MRGIWLKNTQVTCEELNSVVKGLSANPDLSCKSKVDLIHKIRLSDKSY